MPAPLASLTHRPHRLDTTCVVISFRCVMMALVHDIAEADVGDITPEEHSGVTKVQKLEMEAVSRR